VLRDEFREEPRDVELAAGHDALLGCRPPRALPAARVSWTRGSRPLDPADDDRVFVDEAGSLHVLDARRDDAGLYRCVAENVAGRRVSAPATLTVRGIFSTTTCWWRGTLVERRSLAGELSLSCARLAADG